MRSQHTPHNTTHQSCVHSTRLTRRSRCLTGSAVTSSTGQHHVVSELLYHCDRPARGRRRRPRRADEQHAGKCLRSHRCRPQWQELLLRSPETNPSMRPFELFDIVALPNSRNRNGTGFVHHFLHFLHYTFYTFYTFYTLTLLSESDLI